MRRLGDDSLNSAAAARSTALPAGGIAVVFGASGGIGHALAARLGGDCNFADVLAYSRAGAVTLDLCVEASIEAVAADVAGSPCASDSASTPASAPASASGTVWLLEVSRNRALVRIPLLVAPAPQAAATFAAATITACWPAPGAAELRGLLPSSLTLTLGSVALTAPTAAGTYRWRAQLTPYGGGADRVENVAGTVEVQSLVLIPAALRISATLTMRRTPVDVKVTRAVNGRPVTVVEHRVLVTRYASLTGTATEADSGIEGTPVDVLGASSPTRLRGLTQVTADARGAFATLIQINTTAKTVYFRAQLELGVRDRGAAGCVASFGASVPCSSASSGALTLTSPLVRLATGR